jgi:cellulose synthase/poly-beta-1,6-N-acetylglucosamine synthase-like glycosyltransferase/spore germination protein YaaH/peptidoglycan/xylan/chitin deacetylase (PgdA/CDA1 family)
MPEPIFYDPQRRRWKRLRRLFDALAVATTLVIIFFVVMVFRQERLPNLLLPAPKHQYKALKEKERHRPRTRQTRLQKKGKKPSQVVLNSGEGIRAAFYVTWDAGSLSSLRDYVHQIDLLYPEWLHVLTPDGHLESFSSDNARFDVIQNGRVHPVDNQVMPLLKAEKADTEVFPLVNNFDPLAGANGEWLPEIGAVLDNPAARQRMRSELAQFLSTDHYKGLTLDFEEVPLKSQPGYLALVDELSQDLHARGLKLYVCLPTRNEDYDYKHIAESSDGVILMNYDQHSADSGPGTIASQDWFTQNVQRALEVVPPQKLIVAIANYGYDWSLDPKTRKVTGVQNRSVQEAWLGARESDAEVEFDSDTLSPHYAYLDGNVRHEIWFTDAVTALNQMRAAQHLGINTFALWRLGSEDRSMWAIFDQPQDPTATDKLTTVPPGFDVDVEGNGEIIRVGARPEPGTRTLDLDKATGLVDGEVYSSLPTPYQIDEFGARDKQIAITFDDGPDPKWTPLMLDVLKKENVKAAFFIVGSEAEKFPSIVRRMYEEGHEIGNHTWTHPDISNVRRQYMQLELNLTERFFASTLGVKPLLFRPPYSIDQEPDTGDQVRPLELSQEMGYITVGDKLDPNDWKNDPRPTAEQITQAVLAHLPPCNPGDFRCGNIVLLHDGGGDRSNTVKALPMIIDELRARGYELVPVSTLMGKTYADVMPPISAGERWSARMTRVGFWGYALVYGTIVLIFFIGDVLMSFRLVFVGLFAIYDRLRGRKATSGAETYKPAVAVLVPAFNEEKVIVRTVRSVLHSHYPNFRVIVIDDGSKDKTLEVAQEAFADEIASGKVTVLTKPNGGKAAALNYGLEYVTEDIFIGIDADTIIAPSAISYLVPNFSNPNVGAVAGNAKVGNRVNLWTRWQALEYITSQNFERRALDVFGAVTVVPGAIGAWRTSAVRNQGGYHTDTVAEDADLTMRLLRDGYRVVYEDRALAFTEAPHTASGLMRQRFRWSYGIMQSAWKHRSVFLRKGVLGFVSLPNILIFQILLPLVSPFIDVLFLFGILDYAVDKYFHPDTANPANLQKLAVFFLTFLVIDFIASTIAFALERQGVDRRENIWLLAHVWLQRFAYRQLFSIVLIKTLKRALDGKPFGWDKLERTATVKYDPEHATTAAQQ